MKFRELVRMMVDADLEGHSRARRSTWRRRATLGVRATSARAKRPSGSGASPSTIATPTSATAGAPRTRAYYRAIERLVRFVVPEGASVLEIGCGTGDLLAALKPASGRRHRHLAAPDRRARAASTRASTSSSPTPRRSTRPSSRAAPSTTSCSPTWSARSTTCGRVPRAAPRLQPAHARRRHLLQLRVGAAAQARRAPRPEDAHRAAELARHGRPGEPARAQPLRGHPPRHGAAAARRRAASSRRWPTATWRSCPGCATSRSPSSSSASWPPAAGPIPTRDYSLHASIVPCKNERGNIDDIVARTPEMGTRHRAHLRRRQLHRRHGRGDREAPHGRDAPATCASSTRATARARATPCARASPPPPATCSSSSTPTSPCRPRICPSSTPPSPRARASSSTARAWSTRWRARRCASSTRSATSSSALALSAILEQRLKDTLCGTKVLFRRDYERIAASARLLRRLRSVRRLRSALRRRQAEPEDRRAADPLPRAHLRRDQDQPLPPRRASWRA